MKGAVAFREEVEDMQETALNNKNPVVDNNDLTQRAFALNTNNSALNNKNPVVDNNDLTQSPFKALKKWGGTPRPAPVTWVVRHLFQADVNNYIAGEPGVGKSWVMCDLAVSVATGQPFLERETEQGPVLIVNFDDTESLPRQYAERTARARGYEFADLPLYYYEPNPGEAKPLLGVLDVNVFQELAFQVKEIQPKMVIIDSFSSSFAGQDGNKGQDVQRAYEALRQLIILSPGCCGIMIDHTPKEIVMQSKRRGVSGSQQKNAAVRSGHIISRVEPSEVGGGDVLRWDCHKINGCAMPKSFAISREQTADTAQLIVQDLPENERAPKATQAREAALTIIQGAGDAGIARTDLIEQVAKIANVGRRTIEAVIDQDVRPHSHVIERLLPGRGKPKGYKWRTNVEEGGGTSGESESTQSAADSTQPDDLTQTPIALNKDREARENVISRNDAEEYGETALREKTDESKPSVTEPPATPRQAEPAPPFWPTALEHPFTLDTTRHDYLAVGIGKLGKQGRRLTDDRARDAALFEYLAACSGRNCDQLEVSPQTSSKHVEALSLYGAARELNATGKTKLAVWVEAAQEYVTRRERQQN